MSPWLRRFGITIASLALLEGIMAAVSDGASAASFTGLGHLPGDFFGVCAYGNPRCSFATAVSADGKVAVGYSTSTAGRQAFRWENGVMTGLGDLPGGSFSSAAYGVSANGSVVVGEGSPTPTPYGGPSQAFRWVSGVMTNLGGFPPLPGQPPLSSQAFAVSADGSVVVGGGQRPLGGTEAFRWTAATGKVGLGDLDLTFGPNSTAFAVSANGSVVAGQGYSTSGIEAFRWTQAGGIGGLGALPGSPFYSRANGISADGSVIVGASHLIAQDAAFRWTLATGMVALTGPTVIQSRAYAASGDGSVVVGFSYVGPVDADAFIWDPVHGVRLVKDVLVSLGVTLPGWTLTEATGVSSDGLTVVGNGTDPDGHTQAWIADLSGGPTPALVSLVSAEGDDRSVRLKWFTPGAAVANVYRRTLDSDWLGIASVDADGAGMITYEDRSIEPERRYGYRVGISAGTSEQFSGEVWISTLAAPALSLEGLSPNPGDRELVVSFSLPTAAPAAVELMDLSGRIVARRDVEARPGSHRIHLRDGRSLAPGIYLLRLTQDGHSVTHKACIVH